VLQREGVTAPPTLQPPETTVQLEVLLR